MKLRSFYFVLMAVCSLNQVFGFGSNGCDSLYQSSEIIEPKSNDTLQNDTLEFVLKNGYIIQWVNAVHDVVWNNDKYQSINRRKKIRLLSMYEQLGDTTNLNIYVPYKKTGPLRMGDLVYIRLMHGIYGTRIAKLYGYPLHWFDTTSPIMGDGLLDWLEEDRENIVKKLCRKYQNDTTLYPN